MSEELKAKIRRANDEVWHAGNLDALDEITDANYVHHRPPFGTYQGLDAWKQLIAQTRSSYPDCRVTIEDLIVEGNVSVLRWTFQGTQTVPSVTTGAPPSGNYVTMTGCSIAHWRGGKVVEEWEHSDYLGILQQIGVIPPLSKGKE